MQRKKKNMLLFHFQVAKEEIFKDILNLDVSKECQDNNISSKVIRENANTFASLYTLVLIRLSLTRNFHQF